MTTPPNPTQAGAIPAGMVLWHGGDSAPGDWDGGPVLWPDGVVSDPGEGGDIPWKLITAYTPLMTDAKREAGAPDDTAAAIGMLEHAFRNVGVRALKDVRLADIVAAFRDHRTAATAELVEVLEALLRLAKVSPDDSYMLEAMEHARDVVLRAKGKQA